MRKVLITVGICLIVMALGTAALLFVWLAESSASKNDPAVDAKPSDIPSVEVMPLQATTVEDRLALTGTVTPWEDVTLSAETSGKIEWQGVEEGDTVKAGQELIKVDTEVIRARLDQAKAHAKLAGQEYERVQQLSRKGVSAARDLDTAVANREVSDADLRMMEIQLAKSVLRAPFDGTVDKLFQERNEFVDIGAPLVRLVQVHKVKVEVGIPECDVSHFSVGDPVHVQLDAIKGREFPGSIHRLATTADTSTHTFTTEVAIDNPEGIARPGMIARAGLVRQEFPNSILVPIFSTFLLDDKRYSFVVVDGKAQLRTIQTGVVQGGSVQVVGGVAPGDLLIVKGQYNARDGEPVQVRETAQ